MGRRDCCRRLGRTRQVGSAGIRRRDAGPAEVHESGRDAVCFPASLGPHYLLCCCCPLLLTRASSAGVPLPTIFRPQTTSSTATKTELPSSPRATTTLI